MKKGSISFVFFSLFGLLLIGSFLKGQQKQQRQQRRPHVPWEERSPKVGKKVPDIMKYNPDPYFLKDLAELYMLSGEQDKANETFGKRFAERQVSDLSYTLMQYAGFWVKQETNTENAEAMMELALKVNPDRWYNFRMMPLF